MMEERKQAMKKYVIRRILSGILTIFIVFTLTFILIKSAPGDPIRTLLGQDNDDPVLQAALEEKWGLNKSLPEQYLAYLSNAVQGDLGTSIIYERSVNDMIGEKVGATVLLGLTSAILALIIGTAMAELTSFPSVPVKVTLDEWIEISKYYSTPGSSTFINGVLDKIVESLTAEGRIKKAGRGLI